MNPFAALGIAGVVIIGIIVIIILIIIASIVTAIIKFTKKTIRTVDRATNEVKKIDRTVKEISKVAYGTDNIVEGFKQSQFEHSVTQKSVSNGESVYLPKIVADFPNYNSDEMLKRAQAVLNSYLYSIDQMDSSQLAEGNEELKNKLSMHIKSLIDKGYTEHFDRIKVHKIVLKNYSKKDGRCIVTFQAPVQYYHYIKDSSGKILNGRTDMLTQARYEVSLIYIQDRTEVKKASDLALGANCPNCGAPIGSPANGVCPFCGTKVEIKNIYAWTFSDVYEG